MTPATTSARHLLISAQRGNSSSKHAEIIATRTRSNIMRRTQPALETVLRLAVLPAVADRRAIAWTAVRTRVSCERSARLGRPLAPNSHSSGWQPKRTVRAPGYGPPAIDDAAD